MHVIAHLAITDPDGFSHWTAEPAADRPVHWRLVLCVPTTDGADCFCLWWADSPSALQRFLERTLGDLARVACYEVDEENSLGLARLGALIGPLLGRA